MKKSLLLSTVAGLLATSFSYSGNLLLNGNMEAQGAWQVCNLNSPAGKAPTLAWGSATLKPTAGVGNALYVTAVASAENDEANVVIYQAVTLSADSIYDFNASYKYAKIEQSWVEAWISKKAPVLGSDWSAKEDGDNPPLDSLVTSFGAWDEPLVATDGTFADNITTTKPYHPVTSGTYYFGFKMGAGKWDADATAYHLEVSIDELSLTARNNTAISDIYSKGIQLNTSNNRLTIDGFKGNVSIYNSNGQLVQSQKTGEKFVSNLLHSGLYIVNVDGHTAKFIIR